MSQLAPPRLKGKICLFVLQSVEIGFLLLAFERTAAAYVDPGTGYALLQVIGSTVAGVVFYLRRRLKAFFSLNSAQDVKPSSAASVEGHEPLG